jgi:hypothetical protein
MIISVSLSTKPAPLVLATITSHVIASGDFLNSSFALRAISYISIIGSPAIEILVYISIATPSVPCLTTLEANFVSTLTSYAIRFTLLNKTIAIRPSAPFKIRISVYLNVLLELEIFLKYILRSELPYIFSCIFRLATLISTFNPSDFSICYVELYIVEHTIEAESMRAILNPMKVLW